VLLGYPESILTTYGSTDGTLMQYLNPGIDHNNIYVVDENVIWHIPIGHHFCKNRIIIHTNINIFRKNQSD
jgi:hypothetical protein